MSRQPALIVHDMQRDDYFDILSGPVIQAPKVVSRRPARISDDPALMAGLWIGLILYAALWVIGILSWTVH